jgi:hypothetical protein
MTSNTIVGPRVAVELEGSYALTSRLALALALRGAWESFEGATTDNDNVFVSRNAFGAGILVSARYRFDQASGVTPSLGFLTEMNWVGLRFDGLPDTATWFPSFGPVIGVLLPLGPGAASLEGWYRTPAAYETRKNSPIGSVGLLGGYRLHF